MAKTNSALINISLSALALGLGWFFGRRAEKQHFASLEQRESANLNRPVLSNSNGIEDLNVVRSELVFGQVSICDDYFKYLISALHCFLGGRLSTYESLLDRARREAILRMKESRSDASLFVNLRLDTTTLDNGSSKQGKSVRAVQVLAYSTALWLPEGSSVIG